MYQGEKSMKKTYKFYIRTILKPKISSQWVTFIANNPVLDYCSNYEGIIEKPHRPYRRSQYNFKQRLELIKEHYTIILKYRWFPLINQAYCDDIAISNFETKSGRILTLSFSRPKQFMKEGEIELRLKDDCIRLYTIVFSFRYSVYNSIAIDIGCIQGPTNKKDKSARDIVRELTKELHGLRPRSLMLESLRAIGTVSNVSSIRIVGNKNHIYNHWRKKKKLPFDYDEFSTEIEYHVEEKGDWIVPIQSIDRPIESVASHKRGETRRRRALILQIKEQIAFMLTKNINT
ncbi:MAG: DUF535 family protein [Aliarcobacter sp.]|nr:DUF535 family protein [Aliarcobacter sp.]